MHKIDFISGAPKTFIFQQNSNKNNLGGVMTILFVVIIFIIIFYYLYEYFSNQKYEISYTYNEKYYGKNYKEFYNNIELYPEIEYGVDLDMTGLTENLTIFGNVNGKIKEIELLKKYSSQVSNLIFIIGYKCENLTNCDINYTNVDNSDYLNIYNLYLDFNGYYCDHQNPDSPIKREVDYKSFPFSISDRIDYYTFNWKIIEYEEENSFSSILKNNKIVYGGKFIVSDKFSIPLNKDKPIFKKDDNGTFYKIVSVMEFIPERFGYYDNYKRTRISIFDSIANICSLIISSYGILTFIFCGFYSNSFDNYKIVEKIISKSYKFDNVNKEKKNYSEIELITNYEENHKEELLDVKDKENINIEKEDYLNNDENIKNKKTIFTLPKFHFYDFFYNNI